MFLNTYHQTTQPGLQLYSHTLQHLQLLPPTLEQGNLPLSLSQLLLKSYNTQQLPNRQANLKYVN